MSPLTVYTIFLEAVITRRFVFSSFWAYVIGVESVSESFPLRPLSSQKRPLLRAAPPITNFLCARFPLHHILPLAAIHLVGPAACHLATGAMRVHSESDNLHSLKWQTGNASAKCTRSHGTVLDPV